MSSIPFNIVPQDEFTLMSFHEVLKKELETPIAVMNDVTARDPQIISKSIQELAKNWLGNKECRIPGMPTSRLELWGMFAQSKTENLPAAFEYIQNRDGTGKTAVDLGCGNGTFSKELLKRGWTVIAIDSSEAVLKVLKANIDEKFKKQLTIVKSDISDFTLDQEVDLIVAADVFPYMDPSKFESTWCKIHSYIKKDGVFIGSLFRVPENLSDQDKALINMQKEMGAWLLPDRRMVRPLLTNVGYEITSCNYRQNDPNELKMCIQFVAKKM